MCYMPSVVVFWMLFPLAYSSAEALLMCSEQCLSLGRMGPVLTRYAV